MAVTSQDEYIYERDGVTFSYHTRTASRTKRLRVSVYPGGRVVLSLPPHVLRDAHAQFLETHSQWIMKTIDRMRETVPHFPRLETSQSIYRKEKERARSFVAERLKYWNIKYGFEYRRVSIKNMATRWGSASSKKNLSFHWRIVHLPLPLADYLIVHELCHLQEMNHGPRFWALVERGIPLYKERRRALREYLKKTTLS